MAAHRRNHARDYGPLPAPPLSERWGAAGARLCDSAPASQDRTAMEGNLRFVLPRVTPMQREKRRGNSRSHCAAG